MTTKFTPFRRSLVAACVLAVLAGCATTGPNQNVFYGTGNNFRMNGLQISELQADTFGPGVTRLSVKGRSDAVALDDLSKFYTRKAAEGIAKGDTELFAVAWHLGKLVSKARLEQAVSTELFLNSLTSAKNGTAALPGGARVFLSNRLYDGKGGNGKRASLSDFLDELAVEGTPELNWSAGVKVAALGDALKGIISQPIGSTGNSRQTGAATNEMAVGSAYSVRDANGNKYIVEKVADGIILHNPDGAPTKIDLNQLNALPVPEAPAPYRSEAAKILNNIENVLESDLDRTKGTSSIGLGRFTVPPNKVQLANGTGYLNAQGGYSPSEVPATRGLYSSSPSFKLAIDWTSEKDFQSDPIWSSFHKNCSSGVAYKRHHGEALEYVTYSCRDRNNQVTYSQTYVVGNSMVSQSWDSLLKDKQYAEALKKAHTYGKIAEAGAAFLPLIGNLDAAAKCAGFDSLVYKLTNAYSSRDVNADVRKFVSFNPEQEDGSTISNALDCAQGVAGLGNLRSAITGAASAARINGMVASKSYKEVTGLMQMLDSKHLYGKTASTGVQDMTSSISSKTAAFLAASFYEGAQQSSNLAALALAVMR